ncbi:prephenate dehydrogenase [Falsarthrobacter nasiphocae]|uniref:Prephenate dehydrogenase n=1 Tax=Falsarthrobacter nasiphocae TaxID=189863 RepID=A0AAE3YDW2_9MICC|nr:prephenate dehydrogenase [Falsarthrobacter nasiphocae]MDR6891375.1 prephenate dehydrogenase [Falsarthrobacter nasiphocae]
MAASLPSVLVVGTGLLGASVGLKWRSLGGAVYVRDQSPTAAAIAEDLGAGRLWKDGSDAPDIVVVATPPESTAESIVAALREFPDAVVTDVASIKGRIGAQVRELAAKAGITADLGRYVPGHPMAGRERSGPVAARAELFEAMPWIVCPSGDADATHAVETLARRLGGTVVTMTPEEHDSAVALVSHMPQVAASLVASRLTSGHDSSLALAGNGLRDTTRIAGSDPTLWVQILAGNAAAVRPLLAELASDLHGVLEALEDPAAPGARLALARLLDAGQAGRSRLPGKHGTSSERFAHVMVLLDDRPGQLGSLFNVLADLGVNVEDVRMEHAPGREVGAVDLSVQTHLGQSTADELVARGMNAYHVR